MQESAPYTGVPWTWEFWLRGEGSLIVIECYGHFYLEIKATVTTHIWLSQDWQAH